MLLHSGLKHFFLEILQEKRLFATVIIRSKIGIFDRRQNVEYKPRIVFDRSLFSTKIMAGKSVVQSIYAGYLRPDFVFDGCGRFYFFRPVLFSTTNGRK